MVQKMRGDLDAGMHVVENIALMVFVMLFKDW